MSTRIHQRVRLFLLLAALTGFANAEELRLQPSFGPAWVSANQPFALKLSRALAPDEGRLAVFIDQTDLTQLVQVGDTSVTYGPAALPLPAGEHEVVVSLVAPDGTWKEIGRFPIKVLTRRGFETAMLKPSLDLSNKGQVKYRQVPASLQTRETFQDLTMQGGVSTELKRGSFALRSQANTTGASYVNEALRFGELGDRAPRVDLSSYRIDWQQGPALLSVGHISFGTHRHLMQNFSGRGGLLTVNLSRALSLQFAGASGTSIVGWDNILGLENLEHRMYAATLGVELLPSRPGGARVEGSLLDGSLRPLTNFTQGAIRSAEKSRGHAFRFLASSPSQRFTIDAGITRSRFRPARDEQLEEGVEVVPLGEEQRGAQYVEATVNVLQGKQFFTTQQASVSVSVRYERVEPLFRSVAVFTQSDLQRMAAGLNTTVGPVALQVTYEQLEDNLDRIPSVLRTRTNQSSVNLGIPFGSFTPRWQRAFLLPTLASTVSRTHQYGVLLPVNGGFSANQVPDQMSTSAQASLEWQIRAAKFGYRLNFSRQDNWQPGRELADFEASSGGVFVGFTPTDRFDVSLESSLEEQESIELARTDQTRRNGITLTWRLWREVAVSGNVSRSRSTDTPRTVERDNEDGFVELSSAFRLGRARPGQQQNNNRIFVRYTNREASEFDNAFFISNENAGYSVTMGINLSVF